MGDYGDLRWSHAGYVWGVVGVQEFIKFMEKNESTIMTNEWEPADTEYIEAYQDYLSRA